jgi:hypothetical protein
MEQGRALYGLKRMEQVKYAVLERGRVSQSSQGMYPGQ